MTDHKPGLNPENTDGFVAEYNEVQAVMGDKALAAIDKHGVNGVVELIAKKPEDFANQLTQQQLQLHNLIGKYESEALAKDEVKLAQPDYDAISVIAPSGVLDKGSLNWAKLTSNPFGDINEYRDIARENEYKVLNAELKQMVARTLHPEEGPLLKGNTDNAQPGPDAPRQARPKSLPHHVVVPKPTVVNNITIEHADSSTLQIPNGGIGTKVVNKDGPATPPR